MYFHDPQPPPKGTRLSRSLTTGAFVPSLPRKLISFLCRRVFWESGFKSIGAIANADPKELVPVLMQVCIPDFYFIYTHLVIDFIIFPLLFNREKDKSNWPEQMKNLQKTRLNPTRSA